MLIKRRCIATGVVNFYSKHEPHIAIGSVTTRVGPVPYVWRYHGESLTTGGTAREWVAVERALNAQHRRAQDEAAERCAA